MLEDEFKKVRPFSWITFKNWFTKCFINLRDEENLTENQKRYIKRWSFGPFFWFLYAPFRYLWYILGFFTLLSLLISANWKLLNFSFSSERFLLYTGLILFRFLMYILFCWLGRRLSWNKGKWKTFISFKRSEIIWNCVGLVMIGFFIFAMYKIPVFNFYIKNLQTIFSRPSSPNQPYFRSPLFPGP
jgi:hypothetical protein